MSSSRVTAVILALACAFTGAGSLGCSDDAGDDGGATYNCEAETRDEQFLAGMQKVGAGGVQVTLMSATPAPPGRDDNTWVIDVAQGGAPLAGARQAEPPAETLHGEAVEREEVLRDREGRGEQRRRDPAHLRLRAKPSPGREATPSPECEVATASSIDPL